MTRTRLILAILAGLLVLAVVAVLLLVRNLDSLVARAVERHGSAVAGTAVRVQEVEIGLRAGTGAMRGLTVANPPGFSQQPIFTFGDILVNLDIDTLTNEVPVVEQIRILAPAFHLEVDAQARSNLEVMRDNLRRHSAARQRQPERKEPVRLLIRQLLITEGSGVLDLTAVGGDRHQATLPAITLNNLGGEQGLTPEALAEAVLAALTDALQQSALRQKIEKDVRGRVEEEAGKLRQRLEREIMGR
jgi:uncharacterized protein involved in outer membrane biogenesis